MKKAFTMLELIAVIVVVAILSLVMLPRFTDSKLREAADQIISHIRYTQHLAMTDDRYAPEDANWSKSRWQIGFWQCVGGNGWYYVVGHDADYGGGIGVNEAAVNPSDGKHLFVSNTCDPTSSESSEILITKRYGIENVTFSSSCGSNSYIAFDRVGRPYRSTLGSNMYDLVTSACQIHFQADDGDFNITIEPETGYVHLTSINY